MMVDHTVYMTIANSFLRPHLKYRIEKEKLQKDRAIPVSMLDAYIKDMVGSFLLFWVVIGPVVYQTYFKKQPVSFSEDDKYTRMLKKTKNMPLEGEAGQGIAGDSE